MVSKVALIILSILIVSGSVNSLAQKAEIYQSTEEKKETGQAREIAPGVTWGGLLELEAGYESADNDESDISLATFQINIDAVVTDNISACVVLLYEDGFDGVEIDEATICIEDILTEGLNITAGKQFLSFGVYPSHFITGPLTSDIGETNETALTAEYGLGLITFAGSVFNADISESGNDDSIDDFVVAVSADIVGNVNLNLSYISNVLNSDTLSDEFEDDISDNVAAYCASVEVALDPFWFAVEYLAADKASAEDLDFDEDGIGDEPWALNAEAAYAVTDDVELGVKYEKSDELLDLAETRYGVVVSKGISEYVAVSLEYLREDFEDGADADLVTAQMVIEF